MLRRNPRRGLTTVEAMCLMAAVCFAAAMIQPLIQHIDPAPPGPRYVAVPADLPPPRTADAPDAAAAAPLALSDEDGGASGRDHATP